jgi:hypothetical protein
MKLIQIIIKSFYLDTIEHHSIVLYHLWKTLFNVSHCSSCLMCSRIVLLFVLFIGDEFAL